MAEEMDVINLLMFVTYFIDKWKNVTFYKP